MGVLAPFKNTDLEIVHLDMDRALGKNLAYRAKI
jgi:hypothetical protein